MGKDGLGRFFFEVRRVAVLSQDAFDHNFDLIAEQLREKFGGDVLVFEPANLG